MKLILITIGAATVLPIVLHRSRYRRIARITAGTVWAFFIALPVFFVGVVIFDFFVVTLVPPCFMPTGYHIARIYRMVENPRGGWEDTPHEALEHLRQCKPDQHRIAMAMLSHGDGTVVSLGMNLIVQESFDDGDALLAKFHDDRRWNHNLALNDEYSKFMLVLWKMKKDIPLSVTEKESIEGWSDEYFKRVGVMPPTRTQNSKLL